MAKTLETSLNDVVPAKEQGEQRHPRPRKTLRSLNISGKARHEQVQVMASIGKAPFGGGLSQMVNVKVILQRRCTQGDNTRTVGILVLALGVAMGTGLAWCSTSTSAPDLARTSCYSLGRTVAPVPMSWLARTRLQSLD